jgi:hypothetical protein
MTFSHDGETFRRNALHLILTAFAFSSLGRSDIGANEQGFQTRGGISPIEELPFVIEARKELQCVWSRREGLPANFEPAQHLFRPGPHESDDPESQDPIDPNYISSTVVHRDLDIESFQDLLQEELAIPLSERL